MSNRIQKSLLALCGLLSLPLAAASALELQAILDKTTIASPSRVEFREVRHNRLLKDDLVFSGYLEYLQNGSLRKVIETPFREAYLVNGDSIEIERDGEKQILSLKKSRSLQTMLGGIEAILAGETEQIKKVFSSELSGAEDDWSLLLRPRSKRIARQLHSLTVLGNAESITSIRFDLQDGEWHEMEIQASNPSP
jgi:hypothetical protein